VPEEIVSLSEDFFERSRLSTETMIDEMSVSIIQEMACGMSETLVIMTITGDNMTAGFEREPDPLRRALGDSIIIATALLRIAKMQERLAYLEEQEALRTGIAKEE
jgi:hypothetical protein